MIPLPVRSVDLEVAWPLTGVSIGDVLPSYPTRLVFKVHADQGTFVAKVKPAPLSDLTDSGQCHVLNYLEDRHFAHAPVLLRSRTGKPSAYIDGSAVCMLEFIPKAVDDGESTAGTWWHLGCAAARLNAHNDYSRAFALPLQSALDDLVRRVAGRPFEARFLDLLARVAHLQELPADALVHGEIDEANTRRREDGTVVLVDWDQAGMATPAIEYGYPLISVFLSEDDLTFDGRSASAFYHGYLDAGGIIDRRQVFNAALFHALRYMWWGDTEQRWNRIVHAVSREEDICSVVPGESTDRV